MQDQEPKWLTPIEARQKVTLNGVKLRDDIAKLDVERARAYHEYMEAAVGGAPPLAVEALKDRLKVYDEALREVVQRAEKFVLDLAAETVFLAFGYVRPGALRSFILPEFWHFLSLDFESRIATGEGLRFFGVSFVETKGAPPFILLAAKLWTRKRCAAPRLNYRCGNVRELA